MKPILKFATYIFLSGIIVFTSCKKVTDQVTPASNLPPIAKAGSVQAITLPVDSVLLDGSSSFDTDGKIVSYKWSKISGPVSSLIINPDSSKTSAKTLVMGVYKFELTVTDNGGLTAKDTVQIIVDNPKINQPPIAKAGADQAITLPTNSVTLNGGGSTDPDNNITTYVWTKISGPSAFNIANSNAVQTQVNNLVQGVYGFELKVTDANGLSAKDTIVVIVFAPDTVTSWAQLGDLPYTGFLMSIDKKLYLGNGYGQNFLEYDPQTNLWIKKSGFPGAIRNSPLYFSINGKGYVGMGWDNNNGKPFFDLWEYDPSADKWTKKNDLPNYFSTDIIPLVIDQQTYFIDGKYKSVTAYNPATDTYTRKKDFPGSLDFFASGFVISDRGYCIGYSNYNTPSPLWEYNPVADSWQQKNSLPSDLSSFSSFSLNNAGYVCSNKRLWRYVPSLDHWNDQPFPGTAEFGVITASLNGIAYIGLGGYSIGIDDYPVFELWSFKE
ncbi:MAG: PKD domain-containing protein [Ginsengibacter sp.]